MRSRNQSPRYFGYTILPRNPTVLPVEWKNNPFAMRVALSRAGFVNSSFRRGTGPFGEKLIVEARKSDSKK
jgi:hypothetical protein